MTTKSLTIKASEQELENLEFYCQQTGRTKTDVIREYLRSLKDQRLFWQAYSS